MWKKTGHFVLQPTGYKAFMPLPFPPASFSGLPVHLGLKHAEAMRLIGKLDGITQLLPDKDFFLLMFVKKEATSSSQIEGTRATLADAVEAVVLSKKDQVEDVDDIIFYTKALNYGMKLHEKLPISVRFIRNLHEQLMKGARYTQHPFPGDFRYTQNWIGGSSPSNAVYVPPPPQEISKAIGDLEKFIHNQKDGYPPLIKAALLHSQFEAIHPFTDGNGRTGRLLVTIFIWKENLLELPVLYLSDFFRKNQNSYYRLLQGYHSNPAEVDPWLDFFLEGVIDTANAAIQMAADIASLREEDMLKIHGLGKVAANTAIDILRNLYAQPIIDAKKIIEWTPVKTRAGAQKIIDRFITLQILSPRDPDRVYARTYEYKRYLKIFQKDQKI